MNCRDKVIPISVCFIVTALLLSAILSASTWITWYQSATASVNDVAERLNTLLMEDLFARISGILNDMSIVLREWVATEGLLDKPPFEVQRFARKVCLNLPDLYYLNVARKDGGHFGAIRGPAVDDVYYGERPGTPQNTSANMTFYLAGLNGEKTNKVVSTVPGYNPVKRPWYVDAVKQNRSVFSAPFQPLWGPAKVLTLSMPVWNQAGETEGVLVTAFSFASFEENLRSVYKGLRSTGMFLLLGPSGELLAKVSDHPSSVENDIREIQSLFQPGIREFQDRTSFSHTFSTFGTSLVLQILFEKATIEGFETGGLDWKLIVVLPTKDLFSDIWHKNALVAIYTAVYFVVFMVVFILMFHLLITRPLRLLVRRIHLLEIAIRDQQLDHIIAC